MSPLLTVDEIVRCALTAGLKFLISGEMNKCVSAESIPPSSGTERNFESLIRNVVSLVCKNVSSPPQRRLQGMVASSRTKEYRRLMRNASVGTENEAVN